MEPTTSSKSLEELKIQQLRQELIHGKVRLYLSILGSVILLAGVAFERYKAFEQRKTEIDSVLFNQRREAYLALADAAAAIAACKSYEDVEKASIAYATLFRGRAHVIAAGDSKVTAAKLAFYKALREYLATKPPRSTPEEFFAHHAMEITLACQPNLDPRKFKERPN